MLLHLTSESANLTRPRARTHTRVLPPLTESGGEGRSCV
nr:MAG TPA: hypothetical protein [Caudoviricetes sp.]